MIYKVSILSIIICLLIPLKSFACESLVGRQIIDQLINNQPNHAQKILSNQLLRNPSYPMKGFYQGTILWARSGEGQNKELAQKALVTLKKSINTSQQKLKKFPDSSIHRLNSGMSQMLIAMIYASRSQWIAAYRNGKRARLELQRLMRKNHDEKDVLLGLGLFEFYTGSVPPSLRWLTSFMNFKGNKQKGIQLVERAVKESPSFAPEAGRAIVSQIIYSDTKNICKYLYLSKNLRQRYPNNPQFSFAYQKVHNSCGYPQQALNDNTRAKRQFAKYAKVVESLNIQTFYIFSNLAKVKNIIELKGKNKLESYHREVALGMAYDVIGEREKAKATYLKAQKFGGNINRENKKINYLVSPYKKPLPQPITSYFPIAKGCG